MTTPIHINDHDALNAAFAEKVAGWTWRTFPDGACPDIKHWRDQNGEPISIHMDGRFTRSMDAVLPYIKPEYCAQFWGPVQDDETWQVLGFIGGDSFAAEAPTLPHAAVVALLRARGVAVTGIDAEPDNT